MKDLNGWLVVNRFLHTNKFSDISARFMASAEKLGVGLSLFTNDELLPCVCGSSAGDFDMLPPYSPDFVLFYDKDVRLAEQLEKRGMRLFNTARAIELCDEPYSSALVRHHLFQYLRS